MALRLKAFTGMIACAVSSAALAQLAAPTKPRAADAPAKFDAGLPNFDIRVGADGAPVQAVRDSLARKGKTAASRASLAALRARDQFIQIDDDALFGTPRFIRSVSQPLTASNPTAQPNAVVRKFVADNAPLFEIDGAEIDAAKVTRDYKTDHNGATHLTFQQQVGGINIFNAELRANLTRDGRLINVSSTMIPRPAAGFNVPAAALSDIQAIHAASASVGVTVTADPTPKEAARDSSQKRFWNNSADFNPAQAIVTERVLFPMTRDSLRPAWFVVIPTRGVGHTYEIVLDAVDGTVLFRSNELCFDSTQPVTMRVYTGRSPTPGAARPTADGFQYPYGSRSLVTINPADVTTWSPNGWINDGDTETSGNNVDAHLDRNADNVADRPRPNGGPSRVFDFFQDNGTQDASVWWAASVSGAFYLANVYHDRLYALGFNEAAGNFQNNNFGNGGIGNDAVQLDCQDGSGTNNANFSTPADGQSGRAQMYLFTAPTPDRDGGIDADVLFHEFTHGLSNRLTGGPANANALNSTQSGGMGEGWSDFVGNCLLTANGDDPDATYCTGGYVTTNYYRGVRRFPYTTDTTKNPLTWDAFGTTGTTPYGVARSTEVHNTGEIWCVNLWECRAALYKKYGFAANNLILQLVVDAMKLQPANPTFNQARDAILQADMVDNGGANLFILWRAFAKRGLGFSFVDASSSATTVTQAFDTPPMAESGDAGELPGTAQVAFGTGSFTKISGALGVNDVDMYRINVCDFANFSATTVGGATFNTQLFLFDANGLPITFNDDASATVQSTITGQFLPGNGDYFLAVSASDRDPVSANGEIWADAPTTTERQPDGPGAGSAITGWTGSGDPGGPGTYTITLTGACATTFSAAAPVGHPLTAFGAPSPASPNYPATGLTTFFIYVNQGTLPTSTGLSVSLDASSIGLGTLTLLDNGVAPDVTAGDSIYTAQGTVAANFPPGNYLLPYTVTDGQSRVFNDNLLFTVADYPGACCLASTACLVQNRYACDGQSGIYKNAFTPCEIKPCRNRVESEPNDSIAQATNANQNFFVAPPSLYHLGFTGTISSSSDNDYFNIGVLHPGAVITIAEAGAGSGAGVNSDTLVRLYRSNGGSPLVLVTDDDSGVNTDSLIWKWTVTVDDTYYIQASRFATSNTGSYRIGAFLQSAGAPPNTGSIFTAEVEPNETPAGANDCSSAWRKVQYISTTAGTTSVGDSDFYSYQFTAGDLVSVYVFSTAGLESRINLRNSAGTVVYLEDGSSNGPFQDSLINAYVIPASGTYYVEVLPASGSGPYHVAVYLSTNTPPPLPCAADFNGAGGLTVQDLFDFLKAFFLGSISADFNNSGTVTPQDLFDFLTAYFAGCP